MRYPIATPSVIDPQIQALAQQYGHQPEAILPILQILQTQRNGLTPAILTAVARALQVPPERAYGIASFYSMLTPPRDQPTIRVCDGPVCWLCGANRLRAMLAQTVSAAYVIERTSCLGQCDRAPAAWVDGVVCAPLTLEHVAHWRDGMSPKGDERGDMVSYKQPRAGEVRVMLAHADEMDADSLDSALAYGAYRGLHQALLHPPERIINELEAAGLRGCGGAGFPTGRKWRMVAQAARVPKYVVCNADESEPLAFKDRVLLDVNPFLVLEGMTLAAYAVGARAGFIYIRGEYEAQAQRLERALQQAEARGLLGNHIEGTDFTFHIHVHRGAGAYICGEETALLESLEGRRGEPRIRPPFPATHGYHGLPTIVNNVETFAKAPAIVANGSDWYRKIGNPSVPGTKLYTLLGHVKHGGCFEAPFGLTLRQIIDEFGGGLQAGSVFHFALTGGAAGTIVPASLLDVPTDYTSAEKGVLLGAGAFLICDQTVSPVALLRELLHFFELESCGKCTPCRVGTQQARALLDKFVAGQGTAADMNELTQLADFMQVASFCGLGQSAALPIKSALKHFAGEFGVSEQ
jgi:NADH:ubiquinone oxidoreductase subunit F (NADH-binding)/NADH:ubiquinone oxidoreductase subunit E